MPARADAANASAAAEMFDEARALMEGGEYTRACPKLEVSNGLDPQLGTELHLGHCYEKLGQLAKAHRTFQAAADLAARKRDPREKVAHERVQSLAARLSLLVVHPSDPATGLTITLDGAPIAKAQWNEPVAIEPGEHLLRASAPGRESWQQTFTIGSPARLGIGIPVLAREASTQKEEASAPESALSGTPLPAASPSPPVQRIIGYITLGAGVAGLGLGTAFGLMRSAKLAGLEPACNLDSHVCTVVKGDEATHSRIESLRDQAQTFASGANIAWLLGGIAAASGIVLILTAPRAETPALTLGIAPGGLSLTARTDAL
jgi:hypothetical protein